jgi:lysophospholipase L1-like esterase
MVFPYSAAGTNTPVGYRSSYSGEWTWSRCLKPDGVHPLGATGMSVSTSDPTAFLCIDLATTDERDWTPGFTFKSLDIIGYASGGARPVIVMESDTLSGRRISEKQIWHFDLPYYTDFLKVVPNGLPGELTILGIVLDRPMIGLTYSEIGVNGASTASYLQCDGFERDMALLKPSLVIFSIGINDIQGKEFDASRFISRYEKLMSMVEKASPGCAFLFTTNNDSYRKGSPNPFTEECTRAFRTLAARHKAALFDLYGAMGGRGSIVSWEEAGLAKADRIHFTKDGYELIADMMFEALKQELSNRRKRQ